METTTLSIPALIENSFSKAYSYTQFRELVSKSADAGLSTGNDPKNEVLVNFSKLNDRRMHRLDKTIKIDAESIEKLKKSAESVSWIVLTESWCGDAAQSIPVINKLAEAANIDLKVLLRDENEELMNHFLTNGGAAIPKLIAYDTNTKEVINSWGPRPTIAAKMVVDYKAAHGLLTPEFKEDLQVWYNKDKGADVIKDITSL